MGIEKRVGSRRSLVVAIAIVSGIGLVSAPSSLAQGDSTIAGQVTDATGSVLPGVTVEASSPALIEGSRVTVTAGNGQYTPSRR